MKMRSKHCTLSAAAAAAALLGAQPALAEEPTVEELATPQSSVRVGVGGVIGEARHTGKYTGLNEPGVSPLVDLNYVQRDNQTGTWLKLQGRDLGLDNRSGRFEHEKQGSWNYYFDYSETPRFNSNKVYTNLKNETDDTQSYTGSVRELDLDTVRRTGKVGIGAKFGDGFEAKASYRQERKSGARQWGLSSSLFATDPIDYQTDEVETSVSYTDKTVQLQAGYIGSFFENGFEAVAGGGLANTNTTALPPDNEAHKVHLSGGYNFTPTTRAYFKSAYGRALQNERFIIDNPTAGSPSGLDGRVDTTQVSAGLTARPLPKLSTHVKARYDDRADKTDQHRFINGGSANYNGYNQPHSRTITATDAEAQYRLPLDLTLVGSAGYERINRRVPQMRSTSYRETTEEATYKSELRRTLTEDLTGSVGYAHQSRTGSPWQLSGNATAVNPMHMADRERDKVRVSLDWVPLAKLSTQLLFEESTDNYKATPYGARQGTARFVSLDGTYKLARDWDLTAWASYDETEVDMASAQMSADASTNTAVDQWAAKITSVGRAVGLGLRGQVTDEVKVGFDVNQSWDTTQFDLKTFAGRDTRSIIPDIDYVQTSLKFFTDYEFIKNQGVRFDYVYSRLWTNDWTWTNYVYSTSRTSVEIPHDNMHYLALSYYMKW